MLRAKKRVFLVWAPVSFDPMPAAPRMGSLVEKSRDRPSRKGACAAASPAHGGRRASSRREQRQVNFYPHATEVTASEPEESEPAFTTSAYPSVSSSRAKAGGLSVSQRTAVAVSPRTGQVTLRCGVKGGAFLRTGLLAALFWQFFVRFQTFQCFEEGALPSVGFFIRQQVVLFTHAASVRPQRTSVVDYTSISDDVLPDAADLDLEGRRRNVPYAYSAKATPTSAPEFGRDESNADDTNLEQVLQQPQRTQSVSYDGLPLEEQRPPSPCDTVVASNWQELLRKQMRPYNNESALSAAAESRTTTIVEAFPAPHQAIHGVAASSNGRFRAMSTRLSSSSPQKQRESTLQENAKSCTSLTCILKSTRRTIRKHRLLRMYQDRQRALMIFTTCAVVSAIASVLVAKYTTQLYKRYKRATDKGKVLRNHIEKKVLSLLTRSARARMMLFTVVAGLAGHSLLRQLTILLITFCFFGAFLGVLVMYGSQAMVNRLMNR